MTFYLVEHTYNILQSHLHFLISSRAASRAGVEQPSIILELLNSKDVLEVEPIEPPQLEQKSQNDFEEQQHSQSNQASKELKVY